MKEELSERKPGKTIPGGAIISAAFLVCGRRRREAGRDPQGPALNGFVPLIREHEIDRCGQGAAIERGEELISPAVLRRGVRDHAKAVGNGFIDLSFLMHACLAPPPEALMNERAMCWIEESYYPFVDVAPIGEGQIKELIGF